MMIKYAYASAGATWGIYGLKTLVLNDNLCVALIDLPENLGLPLDQTYAAVATEVVQLLIAEQHVENPADVRWLRARLSDDPQGDLEDWRDMYLTWRDNRYWLTPLEAR